jgi:hypothetical protein
MRLKALLTHSTKTMASAVAIFFVIYMAGALFGAVISTVAENNVTVMGGITETDSAGVTQNWSTSFISFAIFMIIVSLINSQKETRFLITRSVARKEIFLANALFLLPLAAGLTALQMLGITLDGAFRAAMAGRGFLGLALDFQSMQAPDMRNIVVFFAVSSCMLVSMGAIGYLLGTCIARWKIPTIGVLVIGFMGFLASLMLPGFLQKVIDSFRYLFTDKSTGLWIACKHLALAIMVMAAAFPLARRITAARQQ